MSCCLWIGAGLIRRDRYSAFILLYPVGFLSEASLVYLGLVNARDISLFYRGYLFVGLLAYIPGAFPRCLASGWRAADEDAS